VTRYFIVFCVCEAVLLGAAVFFYVRAVLDAERRSIAQKLIHAERRSIAQKLIHAAQGQDALAESEEAGGDAEHAAMRRQNAWAFRKAAGMIGAGVW
jgi:hypothetical protein